MRAWVRGCVRAHVCVCVWVCVCGVCVLGCVFIVWFVTFNVLHAHFLLSELSVILFLLPLPQQTESSDLFLTATATNFISQ